MRGKIGHVKPRKNLIVNTDSIGNKPLVNFIGRMQTKNTTSWRFRVFSDQQTYVIHYWRVPQAAIVMTLNWVQNLRLRLYPSLSRCFLTIYVSTGYISLWVIKGYGSIIITLQKYCCIVYLKDISLYCQYSTEILLRKGLLTPSISLCVIILE